MDEKNLDELRSVEELTNYQKAIAGRLNQIDSEFRGLPLPDAERAEFASLQETDKEIKSRVAELRAREAVVASATETSSAAPANVDHVRSVAIQSRPSNEDIYDTFRAEQLGRNAEHRSQILGDNAKRAVELASFPQAEDRSKAQTHVDKLLSMDTEDGKIARHILNTGSPVYNRAFGKAIAGRPMTDVEARALSLTGASGGFAVPFDLDPTIIPTSNGVVNPIRQIARVIQITGDEWRGVSSGSITATYEAEATETTDNAPTLAQPTISAEKAQAFVPFSIEVGMDWGGLRGEMGRLLQDAKDDLEAAKFISGTGTNEPFGVLTGTTNTVNAAAGQTFTLANLYSLVAALPPRYRTRSAFIGDLLVFNRIRQFDTVGSSAAIWQDSLQLGNPSMLMGRPAYEASEMADVATSVKFLVLGDFSRYVIVDRIGLTVELIPHLMGANRRPTGQRGLYAFWRNGAKVVDANAFRALLGVA
jgi:HK97 family phage major capsid protein